MITVTFNAVPQGTDPESYKAEVHDTDGNVILPDASTPQWRQEPFKSPRTAEQVAERMWLLHQRDLNGGGVI